MDSFLFPQIQKQGRFSSMASHGGDGRGRDEREHVGGEPPRRRGRVRGQRGDVAVGHADDDGDVGAGQRADEPRVDAVEPDLGDGRGLEQPRRLLRRRQVVRHLAVVDADVRLRACTRANGARKSGGAIVIRKSPTEQTKAADKILP